MKQPYEIIHHILQTKEHVQIKLLGDSITHGVGGTGFEQNGAHIVEDFFRSPNSYCWANRFAEFMKERYGATVINNGCSGTKIQFITQYFDTLVSPEDDLVICTIGTNNRHITFGKRDKLSREELGAEVYHAVLELVRTFQAAGKPVIFIANIPASAANEKDGEDFWRILHMDDINAIYKKAQEVLDFPFISMYDLFQEYCQRNGVTVDSLLCDGLHPNDRGYDVMFEILKNQLRLS